MKVNVTELGGGLTRLDIEPTSPYESPIVPTFVADDIMRDVVRREKNGQKGACGCRTTSTRKDFPSFTPTHSWERPLPSPPNREPDGIDIHVDRPRRENYGGVQWAADKAFRNDLAKYRSLEALAKDCDWPAREPMKGAPNYRNLASQKPQTQYVGVPAPKRATRPVACSTRESVAIKSAIAALNALANEFGF